MAKPKRHGSLRPAGKGTWRWELRGNDNPPEGWVPFGKNWTAGSCWGLAFAGDTVYAASHHGGVVSLGGVTAPVNKHARSVTGAAARTESEDGNADPTGATARCNDGAYSHSARHSGSCSHHGGVAQWLDAGK